MLGAAMASQPDLSLPDAVQQCMNQQTPLTLRLLLELQALPVSYCARSLHLSHPTPRIPYLSQLLPSHT